MTIEEMNKEIQDYCFRHEDCDTCRLGRICDEYGGVFNSDNCKQAYELIEKTDKPNINNNKSINHPLHYNRNEAMECIDEMVLIFGVEATKNFCLLNAWKYRYRAADKNGEEDLNKSDWYIRKFKELSTNEV